ncbi:helix-turn-helix domain-containing protein [Streptomyces rimosus]|uniref:hypothetical protein n=1 Tax=Streptomyces rimosus TaxID=1927 RepID=UPI0004BED2AB|nr:hypothetical protein [Streptomyces rimosus]
MTSHEMDELDEQFEVVVGRKAPFSMIPDWVTLYPGSKSHPMYRGKILAPQAKAVYNVLAMHVNVASGDSSCWPSRKTIARILGFSREQSVDQYLDQLDDADAIDREPMTRPNGAKGIRYLVHQMPPAGFEGETNVGEHYKHRREEEAQKLSRGPGRPRKVKVQEAAEPDTDTKSGQPAPAAPPQETAVEAAARTVAEEWWAQAQDLTDQGHLHPLVTEQQRERARTNLVTRIHDAMAAGHDVELIKLVLREIGEWGPAKAKFERMLKRLKDKTPEDIALDKQAQKGATKWWEEAEKLVAAKRMGPLMADTERQRTGYFLNLRTRIRTALAAGYDSRLIWQALGNIGDWTPTKWALDKELRRLSGVRAPRSGSSGRAPIFTNDQWMQGDSGGTQSAAPAPAAPDLDVFGVESDDAA